LLIHRRTAEALRPLAGNQAQLLYDPLGVIGLLNVDSIKAVFWSAIVTAMLAPFLLAAIFTVACDK
jgi:hypothetical protein